MKDAKCVNTPVDAGSRLVKAIEGDELFDQVVYQSTIGSLLYLSTGTRPDIAFAVSNAARFSSNPSKQHWMAVKRIIRYLKGTRDLGILYMRSAEDDLIGFSDSDWAGDLDNSKSTSGYLLPACASEQGNVIGLVSVYIYIYIVVIKKKL